MIIMKKNLVENLIEIEISDDDDFLKIKETLTRMGIASSKKKTLYQTCHILHKRGRYYIVHFKELFQMDGRESVISKEDFCRRNRIALALQEWDMCKLLTPVEVSEGMGRFGVIKHSEKQEWKLQHKYKIGVPK